MGNNNQLTPLFRTSIRDVLKKYNLHLQLPVYPELQSNALKKLVEDLSIDKDNQKNSILNVAKTFLDEILDAIEKNKKSSTSAYGLVVDLEEFAFSPEVLYELIVQLFRTSIIVHSRGSEQFKLIFINLSETCIKEVCSSFDNDISLQIVHPVFPIVLIGKQWKVQILYGNKQEEFLYVNERLNAFFLSNHSIRKSDLFSEELTEKEIKDAEDLVLPYDLMIKKDGEELFYSFVNKVLETPIESNDIGCKIDIPTKIGSKLYVENYYEADFLFQNNFFTDRFAYFIAKDIILKLEHDDIKDKNLILVGYNPYSISLVDRVKDYINLNAFRSVKVTDVIIAKEKEREKGLEFNNKMADSKKKEFKTDKYCFISIVPIASTLSTIDKIISLFAQQIEKTEVAFIYNYVVILVRDAIAQQPTKNEIYRKWKKNGIEGHVINTLYQNKGNQGGVKVDFLIQKAGGWHNLIDKYTFPKDWWKERYINQTKNASLNLKDLLGLPTTAIPNKEAIKKELPWTERMDDNSVKMEYYKLSVRRLWEIRKFIYFGHIDHGGSHQQFFFDIERFFDSRLASSSHRNLLNGRRQHKNYRDEQMHIHKRNKQSHPNLSDWLVYVKESIRLDYSLEVIITPDYDYESCFVSMINNRVFDDNAFVIFVSINDSLQHNKLKLSYLNDLKPSKIRYYFVDQVLLTGNTYQKTKSYMASILGNKNFKFNGVITAVNRLSQSKYDELLMSLETQENEKPCVFSFLHFFVSHDEESEKHCSLCNLHDLYSHLKEYSVIEDCRKEIERNREKFELQSYNHSFTEGKNSIVKKPKCVSENKSYWLRVLMNHRLFFEFARLSGNQNTANNVVFHVMYRLYRNVPKVYDKLNYKISFLKAISFPPLSQYIVVRKCAIKLHLKELHNLLRVNNPQFNDLILLLVILKHLAFLGSNALVRKDVIIKSWELFNKVCKDKDNENKMYNIRFKQRFVFYLKLSTYKDDAKSIWIGELLRTGFEINIRNYSKTNSYKVSSTTLFNDFFKVFLSINRGWLPLLFYDNTAITRKTLENFEFALAKDEELKYKFYNKSDNNIKAFNKFSEETNIQEIITEYQNKINTEYYYSWFRHYVNPDNITADGIPILKKFVFVLYARLLIKNFLVSKQNIESFDNNAKRLLEVAAQIMDADAAFISIKAKPRETMYVLAKHKLDNVDFSNTNDDRLYCRKLLFEQTLEKGRPFVIRKDISEDEGSYLSNKQFINSYKSATFLMLNGAVKMHPSQESPVGVVAFLYNRENSDTNDEFMINTQESGRLLLLLKPQMDEYVEHIAKEKQFEVWKEKYESLKRFEKVYSNSRHVFKSVFSEMAEFENLRVDLPEELEDKHKNNIEDMVLLTFCRTWYWLTNEMISYLYANIERNSDNGFHYLCLDMNESSIVNGLDTLRDVFSINFIRLLKNMLGGRWSNQDIYINDISIAHLMEPFNIESFLIPSEPIHCNKHIIQTFITQCLNNSLCDVKDGGHRKCSRKKANIKVTRTSIVINDEIFEGDNNSAKDIQDFERKKPSIQGMDCTHYSCTTLTSLQGFIDYMKKQEGCDFFSCDYGFEGKDFMVRITFNN